MPLVVAAILSVSANAYFYTASMISALLAMAPISLAMATYAVGAQAPEHLPHRLRFSLVLSLALVAGANLVLFVAAEPMLRIFGDAYAQEAAWTLRILSLTVFARIVQVNYDVVSRLRGRLRSATVMVGLFGVVELGLAAVGGILYGLEGLALGWLAGACIQAAVMLPRVLGEARPRRTAQDTIPAAGP
jgi:Na+-driven multidrug efflux pump